jgi:hypothetical protein
MTKLNDLLGMNFAKSLTIHFKPKKMFLVTYRNLSPERV